MTRLVGCCVAALLCSSAAGVLAQAPQTPAAGSSAGSPASRPGISIELNKLESASNACRGYFIVTNRTPGTLKELGLDVFLFDKKGVILRRVGLTFLDIRSDRMKVVLFDLADLACGDIGRLLVNDVIACASATGAPIDGCSGLVTVSSRTGAEFNY
jgi:hypothetical protein